MQIAYYLMNPVKTAQPKDMKPNKSFSAQFKREVIQPSQLLAATNAVNRLEAKVWLVLALCAWAILALSLWVKPS